MAIAFAMLLQCKPSFFLTGCVRDCCSLGFDCRNYQEVGHTSSGVYYVTPPGAHTGYDVHCDMTTDGGGWLAFQRRVDSSEDFYRNWDDYEHIFGNVSNNYWLGLLPLKRYLSQGGYMFELRVDLEDFEGESRYAKYSFFNIGEIMDSYTLYVTGYSGSAGDGLANHNEQKFSTKDRDNDSGVGRNCAVTFSGAWWYSNCHSSNLNGLYLNGNHSSYANGVNWSNWKGAYYSLKTTEMKVRRI